jgi:hypothetical protein
VAYLDWQTSKSIHAARMVEVGEHYKAIRYKEILLDSSRCVRILRYEQRRLLRSNTLVTNAGPMDLELAGDVILARAEAFSKSDFEYGWPITSASVGRPHEHGTYVSVPNPSGK